MSKNPTRRSRNRRLLALAVVSGMTLAACGSDEERSVSIAGDSFLLGSPAWVAQDQGYFESNGVQAEISMFGTGIEAIQGVIARQADLGHALDFAVLNLVAAADDNMAIVGGIAQPNPGFHSLAVAKGIEGPADLIGKKIGYVPGTSENFVTLRYLEENGIAVEEVELVALPGLFELVGALKSGDIDASWVWLDGTVQAEEDPNLTVLTDDSEVLQTVAIYLIAEASWAEENSETITRVLRAYQQSSDFIASDPVAAAEIVATATGGDAGVFANNLPGQNFRVEITQVMVDSLDAIAGFLIDNGVLEADFDVREFMKLEAMEAVDPGLITADVG